MAKSDKDAAAKLQSPVTLEMNQLDTGSTMALVGHPLHVMMVHFPVAFVRSRKDPAESVFAVTASLPQVKVMAASLR